MDDISLVKSEPNADGTAYDEETVGMNSSSDTEDEDSCEAIINEDNLIELPLEQTSKMSYPLGCPVWYGKHKHDDNEAYSYGTIVSIHFDVMCMKRYYRIKAKAKGGSNGSIGSYSIDLVQEDKVFYAAKCPVLVQVCSGEKKEMKGEIICPRRSAYTVMLFLDENRVMVEDGVVPLRIKYHSSVSTIDIPSTPKANSNSEEKDMTSKGSDQQGSLLQKESTFSTRDGDSTHQQSKVTARQQYQMVKEGRVSGYPIVVTQAGSSRENQQDAILLGCNTENPQDFLDRNKDGMVKIRWKFAAYKDSVPTNSVRLVALDFSRESKGKEGFKEKDNVSETEAKPYSSFDRSDSAALFVAGLSLDTTEEQVSSYFRSYGDVESVRVIRKNGTSATRGFAFVEFKRDDAVEAVLNDDKPHEIEKRSVNVSRTIKKGERSGYVSNDEKRWVPLETLAAERERMHLVSRKRNIDDMYTAADTYKQLSDKIPRKRSRQSETSSLIPTTILNTRKRQKLGRRSILPKKPEGCTSLFIGCLPLHTNEEAIKASVTRLLSRAGVRLKALTLNLRPKFALCVPMFSVLVSFSFYISKHI